MNFIVCLNKPGDITSQDAVTKVKRILKVKKAGHTGTLDPIATGLLLICINKATRLASYFTGLDKEYRAVMKLGESTDTQDAKGSVTATNNKVDFDEAAVKDALKSFEGNILQQPPMFSALKHKGKPLYKYARKGIEIERKHREVTIQRIELLELNIPYVTFKVLCSKGTYIRTLCNDIGEKLGTGAHLFELERTAVGTFDISKSLNFEELEIITREQNQPVRKRAPFELSDGVFSMDTALSWMPELKIDETQTKSVKNGVPLTSEGNYEFSDKLKTATGIKIKSPDGELLAIGKYQPVKNIIKMDIVFRA